MNIERFYPVFLQSTNTVIDSRKVENGSIFFAFSGENYNAAATAEDAVRNGALAVIVEDQQYENHGKNIFYVSSTLQFLKDLATLHRDQLTIPIIGLTGSNGKTTTKELINAVLSGKFKTQFTFGNLNNHIGVPLTLLSIRNEHEIAVIEMGANHQKEIEMLSEIAKPDIGYITNFGKAHLEGFGGFEGVIKGKSELYDYLINNDKKILVNENDAIQREKTGKYTSKITFGTPDSDYLFELIYKGNFVGIKYKETEIFSNLTGKYNFDNISAAVALGLNFNINIDEIKAAVENYFPSNMRSQIQKKEDKTLVLDTYNANPSSMMVSLENFKAFDGSKTVIIGDMLELGEESHKEHEAIINFAKSCNFDGLITVGPKFKSVYSSKNAFENTAELIERLKLDSIKTDNILLKASRGIALEKVIDFL